MFNTTHVERGWWVMSLIQMLSICAHLLVMPYRDYVTNMYEFYCLLSGFIVFQSSMAFTVRACGLSYPSLRAFCDQGSRVLYHA
jgi:hypothetical protein